MPITAPLKLPNNFVHLTLDAMHAAIRYGKGSSHRTPQIAKGVVHTQFWGVSSKMTDQNRGRLFEACRSGDVDTVRRIVGTDPNSVHWRRGVGMELHYTQLACEFFFCQTLNKSSCIQTIVLNSSMMMSDYSTNVISHVQPGVVQQSHSTGYIKVSQQW